MGNAIDTVVVMDASLGSIVACTAALAGIDASRTLRACGTPQIRSQWSQLLEHFGGEWIANKPSPTVESDSAANLSVELLSATLAAVERGIDRVIWPIHAGIAGKPTEMDLDAASRHVDRALLVTRIVAMDADRHHCSSIIVETPYADFSDRQLAELALDMGAPFRKAPWWGVETSEDYRRWQGVFDGIGSTVAH